MLSLFIVYSEIKPSFVFLNVILFFMSAFKFSTSFSMSFLKQKDLILTILFQCKRLVCRYWLNQFSGELLTQHALLVRQLTQGTKSKSASKVFGGFTWTCNSFFIVIFNILRSFTVLICITYSWLRDFSEIKLS